MKLATWNVNSLAVRLPQVLDWLAAQAAAGQPIDVLALQELKMADDKFPAAAFAEAGYHAQWFGQKTYNGVALISRTAGSSVLKNIPGFDDEHARVIAATFDLPAAATAAPAPTSDPDHPVNATNAQSGSVRVIGAYFPNGQAPGSDKFAYKMRWLQALRNWVQQELVTHPRLVLMGDYNITFDDADVWDPEGMREAIHCTTDERNHLQALIDLGLQDSMRLFPQPEKNYSWWDYREFAFRRNRGLRIDHILVSAGLVPLASSCAVDKLPRKNERPSDHAPVVLSLGTAG
ncbi:MAG: exodeoxyribonuclease III [Burkholderiales bacterium]|nr:exodeoxyribonuclease III [Burkholderiales bacterium]